MLYISLSPFNSLLSSPFNYKELNEVENRKKSHLFYLLRIFISFLELTRYIGLYLITKYSLPLRLPTAFESTVFGIVNT